LLCGLTPDGLGDYNRVVGVNHVIRPFALERVSFPAVRNPLTAGLTTGDIVMLSGKRIFGWTADEYVASDVFSYVVDLEDVAPFARSDFPSYDKIVNGFVSSDGWPLIIDFEYPKDGKPFEINLDLPQEETLAEYTHDPSVNYNPTTKIALVFDGKERAEFALQPNQAAHAQGASRRRAYVCRGEIQHLRDAHFACASGFDARRQRCARQFAPGNHRHSRQHQSRCPVLPSHRPD
jgi:beta-galactosidase